MEQFPQRESVPQVGVFHTPRLCNSRWLNWAMTASPENQPPTLEDLALRQMEILRLMTAAAESQEQPAETVEELVRGRSCLAATKNR